jgi:hypothetical protein
MIFEGFWIRTQSAAVACWRATDLATHLSPNLVLHPFLREKTKEKVCNLGFTEGLIEILQNFSAKNIRGLVRPR